MLLAEDYAYISKMNVSGNANIYWEHLNKYGKTMRYGILLHNTTGETVGFRINKKGIGNTYNNIDYTAPIQPWLEYFRNIIRADLTNINSNDTIYIENGGFRWIYLEDIPGSNESVGIVFNGIINLSILGGKKLDCYAFIMNSGYQYTFEADFITNYNSYVKAKDDGDSLSGTSNGPVLESNIGTLDLSDNKKFRLLFTGYEAPYLNAGELMPLYREGDIRENAINYSVVYKLNIEGIAGKNNAKAIFKYNPYTAPAYVDDINSGIYVICAINRRGSNIFETSGRVILTPKYNLCEDIEVSLPSEPFSMYVIVSGMSTTPLTVSFE